MTQQYTRTNPFLAKVKERYHLCTPDSGKNVQHIVLDLSGSGMAYAVGDSIGVCPQNDPEVVDRTLQAMRAAGTEQIWDKRTEKTWLLRDFLTFQANIGEVSRKLLKEIHDRHGHHVKKQHLAELHTDANKEALKNYLASRALWDLIEEHGEVAFSPQEICEMLMPLLPRLYSIASSHRVVGEEVHLTVGMLEYETNGQRRRGVCTHYLGALASEELSNVPVYIQQHHGFTLPEDPHAPIIMIGPGTGIAPFRAFMQERLAQNAAGRNWLFFGERHRRHGYFYEPFWQQLADEGKMLIDLAFSRDQEHKIYVQHRMLEKGQELFNWLEQGAYFFVCGDASRMAKDVEAALLQIIQMHGKCDEQASKHYLKRLRTEKRYLRDVY